MDIKRITPADPLYAQVWQLREDILRRPLGLSLVDEDLSDEEEEIILAGLEQGTVQACVLLKPLDTATVKLRQMAVAEALQGRGLGSELVQAAEQVAWESGFRRIELHARDVAAGFYRRLGYVQEGAPFSEVGIPHLKMIKQKEA